MRYWWVNQNQTYRHEVVGGYLWSPKRKSNDGINPFYDLAISGNNTKGLTAAQLPGASASDQASANSLLAVLAGYGIGPDGLKQNTAQNDRPSAHWQKTFRCKHDETGPD